MGTYSERDLLLWQLARQPDDDLAAHNKEKVKKKSLCIVQKRIKHKSICAMSLYVAGIIIKGGERT